ncbi:neprilysin-21-like [Leptopilina heterotoma]|uniref:neprilysin-21-like n=1 Tax=Leptopilina heterotoma TaxID=63436 RepID=UPI001CA80081|nr:neprilysin-21-like [Leptopilina heterotoma]
MGKRKFNFLLQILSTFMLVVNCQEKSFQELIRYLDSGIDDTVNPCDNFYDYACGNWARNNPKPDGFNIWNLNQIAKNNIISKMRNILESDIFEENVQLAMERKYYRACLNAEATLSTARKFSRDMIIESTELMTNWQGVAEYYASKFGSNFLFHIALKSSTLQILRPREARSNKMKNGKLFENHINNYLKTITHTRLLEYSRQSINFFNKEFKKFVVSVRQLVFSPKSELKNITISELQEIYNRYCPPENYHTHVNWYNFLQKHAEGSEVVFENSSHMNIDIDYLVNLCEIISQTSSIVIVSYMQYNFLYDVQVAFYLSTNKNHLDYNKTSYSCIDGLPLKEKIYELLADSDEFYEKEETGNIVFEGLKSVLKSEIKNSWFDNATKNKALKVVRKMKYCLSRTDFPLIKRELERISYKFNIGSLALENLINFRKAQTLYKIQLSQQSVDVRRRKKRNIHINAAYDSVSNFLCVTTGFFFAPLFEPKAHLISYLYGIMGHKIGHELSHAFDFSRIIQYMGDYISNNELMNSTFLKKKDCMVRHFNNLRIDGHTTLNENVADTQGLKLAFKLLRRLIVDDVVQKKEIERYFFLSFANGYCESRDTPFTDTIHSPPMLRVIGTLMNMPEFAELYHCEEGRTMNPREKCDLWSVPSEPMEM